MGCPDSDYDLMPKEPEKGTYDECGDINDAAYLVAGDSQSRMFFRADRPHTKIGWRDPDTIPSLRVSSYFVLTDKGAPMERVFTRLQSILSNQSLRNGVPSRQTLVLMAGTNDLGMYIWPSRWKKENGQTTIPPIDQTVQRLDQLLQSVLDYASPRFGCIVVVGLPVVPYRRGRQKNVQEACEAVNQRMEEICTSFRAAHAYPVAFLSMVGILTRPDGIHFAVVGDLPLRIEQRVASMEEHPAQFTD